MLAPPQNCINLNSTNYKGGQCFAHPTLEIEVVVEIADFKTRKYYA